LKTIHTTAVALGFTAFLGLAPVGARAGEILPALGGAQKKERPERPEKPKGSKDGKDDSKDSTDRPNLTDIRDVVNSFQADKKKFTDQQKDAAKNAKDEARRELKELKVTGDVGGAVRKELKEAVKEAKDLAAEQARKLKEEEAAAAKGSRGKN
jgi:hypothetical protein